MAHGLLFLCSGCDFQFLGGHHLGDGHSAAICTACMAKYEFPIARGRSPTMGELVELHEIRFELEKRRGRRKHEPVRRWVRNATGQKVQVVAMPPSGWEYANVEALKCTTCGEVGTVAFSLDLPHGAPCPQCKSGTLQSEWV